MDAFCPGPPVDYPSHVPDVFVVGVFRCEQNLSVDRIVGEGLPESFSVDRESPFSFFNLIQSLDTLIITRVLRRTLHGFVVLALLPHLLLRFGEAVRESHHCLVCVVC